ncbi:MAG TPA: hypothetical protein VIV60_02665 [Polyangiaceae bacterium]
MRPISSTGRRAHVVCRLLLGPLISSGCASEPPRQKYEVSFRIQGDPGQPVASASIRSGEREIGKTDQNGYLAVSLEGIEGQAHAFQLLCPDGFRSPSQPLPVILRQVSETGKQPEYEARCEPLLRTVVVAVRTEHGVDLPVLYLGREVARTDSAGAAHFSLKTAPQDTIEITLDTSRNQQLRPRNPSMRFEVAERDDVYLVQQAFAVPSVVKAPTIRKLPGILNLRSR